MAYALESLPTALAFGRVLCGRRALVQPLPSVLQLANRQKGVHFLSDLVVACAFPPDSSGFTLQILDIFGLAAILVSLSLMTSLPWPPPFTCSSKKFSHRSRGIHGTLPELLAAVAEQLTRQEPDDVPSTIQGVLEQLGFELATLTRLWHGLTSSVGDSQRQQLQQHRQSQNTSHHSATSCQSCCGYC